MVTIVPIDTPTLGDRSYLVHDGQVALVVDPQRDIDRVLALAAASAGVRITHVFETHIHNDYVTGGLALARATGAAYHVNADDQVAFERVPVRDGDVVEVGAVAAGPRARHARAHLHPPVLRADAPTASRSAVFSGGSLLFGSTGRPDLLGPDHTHDLVHHQYASAHRLADRAARRTRRCCPPTGSAASARPPSPRPPPPRSGRRSATNPVLTQDEERYVDELLAGLDACPAYYAHMGPANAAGPARAGPERRRRWPTPAELRRADRGGGVGGRPAHPHRVRRRARRRAP